ncbi:transcriptional regulator SgrR [Legionella massiliensis]|uniref:Transcriptional regulator SgrR n=1 Tax=Legionella massiliensis TaxID=1034943 RepID=A0A078L2G9_9GAMM|nr:ABC transporter substrate-binding protein [Legionella massiliensis]CDZ79386.1 transcriptional regulator SgrR [Legionella massiliensis]CEE15124.1 HTH-type transcriptional regulator SgrR [Legionella massiliensis]
MNLLKQVFIVIFLLTANSINADSVNEELRITLQKSNITLDPGSIRDTQSLFISRQINCELIRNQGSAYVLEAADTINYITPLKIRIKLKKIKFHDGSLVKSEDVIASFDYINQSKSVFNNFWTWIDKIQAIDDRTIEISLNKEAPQLLRVLSSSNYTIFKKEFIENAKIDARLWKKPIGCGGYKVIQFGKHVIKLAPISKGLPIRFDVIKDNQVDSNDLTKYDIINLNIRGNSEQLKNFNIIDLYSPKQLYVGLNSNSNRWKNKYERCLFLSSLQIDEQLLNNYEKETELANDFFPKGTFGYDKESDFNKKLSKLAKSAIYNSNPQPLCLAYLTVSVQEKQKILYQNMFKKIYPNISLKEISNVKEYGKYFANSKCDVLIFGLVSDYFDGYEFLTIYQDNKANFTGIASKKLDEQITKSQFISNPLKRVQAYRNIVDNIADLCVVRPIFTSLTKEIFVRKNLNTPGIGLSVFHQYFLGNISRDAP